MYTRPDNLESPRGHTTAALLYTPSAPTENGRMTRKIHLWPIREVTRVYSLAHGSVVTAYIYCSRRVDQSTERARARIVYGQINANHFIVSRRAAREYRRL